MKHAVASIPARRVQFFRGFVFSRAWSTLAIACTASGAWAEPCPPPGGSCDTGALEVVDFESFAPGTVVEGLGAVHPDLAILSGPSTVGSCPTGSSGVIEELVGPIVAYGTASGTNDCLNGIRGFGDDAACMLNYEFTFSPGTTVSCFSIRMLDYGDFFPFGGTVHEVRLRAFAGSTPIDQDILTVFGNPAPNGDACIAIDGDPGNVVLGVVGTGITRVTLEFDAFPDPNIGFDDIQFCLVREAVPVQQVGWGRLKTWYAD